MKKVLLLNLFLAVTLLSCQKEIISPDDCFFSCKVNGVEFSRTGIETYADNLTSGTLTLTLAQGDEEIYMIITGYTGVGTYTGSYFTYTKGLTKWYGNEAVIKISNINKRKEYFEGTFSGSGTDLSFLNTVTATDGSFRLRYLEF